MGRDQALRTAAWLWFSKIAIGAGIGFLAGVTIVFAVTLVGLPFSTTQKHLTVHGFAAWFCAMGVIAAIFDAWRFFRGRKQP